MPRVKLANWYGDHMPGDELDVDEARAKALRRDGLIAEVVKAPAEQPEANPPKGMPTTPEPSGETGRKRR